MEIVPSDIRVSFDNHKASIVVVHWVQLFLLVKNFVTFCLLSILSVKVM